ncbi:hypothetical protein COW36_00215 [bacterium (Candidatus Blackallbacteria) CG17_big_fil_post_rev_8_21_14_2_50_48_46]|uniref:Uncharacterized protein n=1 Tax=bacterium (Candidatus Blackallbacteria) CG17_big_fil_post_rev_8_21_14_2_50_48_46 TaxID=2014261 RepID=A0A2M7GBN9_9BACT|nr:MAG: hypothetical protein COW64_25720 [bacterium (Candidatus Blackallbacteria) CG18_big_fil_WC_8_21_14_2_50_49_26]PIW19605.1 MAG: hypothetical protein COW36_00215 [bacterium (Candidatus Blackallbacteria) CG17_big_fil_post_rev_8_21_14_2_50_48_46]
MNMNIVKYKELKSICNYDQRGYNSRIVIEYRYVKDWEIQTVYLSINDIDYLALSLQGWFNTMDFVVSNSYRIWSQSLDKISINKDNFGKIFSNTHVTQNFESFCNIINDKKYLMNYSVDYLSFKEMISLNPFVFDNLSTRNKIKIIFNENKSFINELLISGKINKFEISKIDSPPPFKVSELNKLSQEYCFYFKPYNMPISKYELSREANTYWQKIR